VEKAMQQSGNFTFSTVNDPELLPPGEVDALAPAVERVAGALERREGAAGAWLGWLEPEAACPPALRRTVAESAARARADCDAYVVIGIGGSYLGARAVLEALPDHLTGPQVFFAGTGLTASALHRLLAELREREFRLCVVSKSGTTLEPALAFRCLRELLVEKYGRDEAGRRITAVTDGRRGALRELAVAEGWETFAVPDDIGGRFSVLTPVGLLPLAAAGVDIEALLDGAARMRELTRAPSLRDNPAHLYAATRHALLRRGFRTEILSAFDPDLRWLQEWWKQLFGESEGKDGRGLFPASATMTADLHSLGQYIQDGPRDLFETMLCVRRTGAELLVPGGPDSDGLGWLAGRSLDAINAVAWEGVARAHEAGGVPCLNITLEALDARVLGALIHFFEKAVAVSGGLLGVDPFDQPGVEAYKKEVFRLLGKP
jgi:glucose-6-phosphate isomerase